MPNGPENPRNMTARPSRLQRLALMTALMLVSAAGIANPASAAQRTYLLSYKCGSPAIRPSMVVTTCGSGDLWYSKLRWHRWSTGSARARGLLWSYDSFRRPRSLSAPVIVTFSAPKTQSVAVYRGRTCEIKRLRVFTIESWRLLRPIRGVSRKRKFRLPSTHASC